MPIAQRLSNLIQPWRRVAEARERFARERAGGEQAFADFLHAAGSTHPEIVQCIREVVAQCCGVPDVLLRSADLTTELEPLFGATTLGEFVLAIPMGLPESMDNIEFFWALENALHARVGFRYQTDAATHRAALERWLAGVRFGTWVKWLAGEIGRQTVTAADC